MSSLTICSCESGTKLEREEENCVSLFLSYIKLFNSCLQGRLIALFLILSLPHHLYSVFSKGDLVIKCFILFSVFSLFFETCSEICTCLGQADKTMVSTFSYSAFPKAIPPFEISREMVLLRPRMAMAASL